MFEHTLAPALFLVAAAVAAQPRSNFAGPDQSICGTVAFMGATALSAGESGYWQVIAGNASFTDPTSPVTTVSALAYGENVLQWTVISASGAASDQVSILAYDPSAPAANAGPDQSVSTWPGTAQLAGSAPTLPAQCFWSVVSGSCAIADPTDPQTTVSGLGAWQTVLQWSCDNGPCGNTSDWMVIEGLVGIAEGRLSAPSMRYIAAAQAIVLSNGEGIGELALFDPEGRLLRTARFAGPGTWSLGDLPDGLYTIRAQRGGYPATLRFAVLH
jgi:hypothetical protein